MSTNQRKAKRAGDLVRRAQSAKELEKQVEDLRAQLDIANRTIEERNIEIRTARTAVVDSITAHEGTALELCALREDLERVKRNDVARLEAALRERGDHIEQLIKERNQARAAKEVADRRLHSLHLEDRDAKKLRRRLAEAKERIEELQTTINRLRRAETNEVTF
jgi:predicted RNase H-like nuclease (RuvC/YqgF family)